MERLEKNAIEILHMICERSECIICDSGGKDSSVLKHIALQAKEKYGFCEYYDMCKQETGSRKEVKENEHEICNEK